ncbi:MAG: amidohydrolase family protein [Pseudonocardia sp.]|nr:amidohydrolase family protein [Pseudonocardia sp.]
MRQVALPGHRKVDLDDGWVMPGFVDWHIHVANCARNRRFLSLRAATGLTNAQRKLRGTSTCCPRGQGYSTAGSTPTPDGTAAAGAARTRTRTTVGHPVARQSHDAHTAAVDNGSA